MDDGKMWTFVACVAVGGGAVCFVKSETGHKAAVAHKPRFPSLNKKK